MTDSEVIYIKALEKELKDLKEQNASLQSMYEMTTIYLKNIQDELKISEQKILQINKNLTDSINYAKRIQDAFILQAGTLQILFKNSFVFQKPKEIVSGDFIWAYDNNNHVYLALGDCTGHGVPGAMLSIFVISMLNQIIQHFDNGTPADILNRLDKLIKKYLTQSTEQIRDSAEIAIIKYDKTNPKIYYSGAKRPLIHIRKGITTIYQGSKFELGNDYKRNEFLENIEIDIQENDMLYMFSDGYADQFGGEKNFKFTTKKLMTLLQDVSPLSIDEQYEQIKSTFVNWQGNSYQIDDVTLLGIRV